MADKRKALRRKAYLRGYRVGIADVQRRLGEPSAHLKFRDESEWLGWWRGYHWAADNRDVLVAADA